MRVAGEPSPYELYIQFPRLEALWSRASAPDWPDGVSVAAGLQATELCLMLLKDTLEDERKDALPHRRRARLVALLAAGLEAVCEQLLRTPPPPSYLTGRSVRDMRRAKPAQGFGLLAYLSRAETERVAAVFRAAGLPFGVGVEAEVDRACAQHGLPPVSPSVSPPMSHHAVGAAETLDYAGLVRPDEVWGLDDTPHLGPEDLVFRTAHQINECWLRVAHTHTDAAEAAAKAEHWEEAARRTESASRAILLATEAGHLLETMNLADYHPLRVMLRDGSGAQSKAARALSAVPRRLVNPLVGALAARGLSLFDVLAHPGQELSAYTHLVAVKAAARSCQNFLFQHYLLVLNVLGTNTRGALGYEVHELGDRALREPLPELGGAQHDLALMTSLLYGQSSGSAVLHNEIAVGWNPYTLPPPSSPACPPDLMRERIAAYFRTLRERDAAGWVGLFDPEQGQMRDNPGARPFRGRRHLSVFITSVFDVFADIENSYDVIDVHDNYVEVSWRMDVNTVMGRESGFEGTEEFWFDDEGLILRAWSKWDPEQAAVSLWPGSTIRPPVRASVGMPLSGTSLSGVPSSGV
ncbi:nuclear transport factor 2 family protein [Streptomyces sp. NPDC048297]|uniref:nuclear transport factor 2 family protein n=1 Tax=Streptomyces sp. NPDC048297 TaxID=3365531 RepID=UPI00372383BF